MFSHKETYAEQLETAKEKAQQHYLEAMRYKCECSAFADGRQKLNADIINAVIAYEALGELRTNWFVQYKVETALRYIAEGYLQWAIKELLEIQDAGYDFTVDESTMVFKAKQDYKEAQERRARNA